MVNNLVGGRTYKVRLKSLEEIVVAFPEALLFTGERGLWDVEAEHHTTNSKGEGLYSWLSRYMDGGLGYATFDDGGGGGGSQNSGVWVEWDVDGDAWYYEWDMLKVLGEV